MKYQALYGYLQQGGGGGNQMLSDANFGGSLIRVNSFCKNNEIKATLMSSLTHNIKNFLPIMITKLLHNDSSFR